LHGFVTVVAEAHLPTMTARGNGSPQQQRRGHISSTSHLHGKHCTKQKFSLSTIIRALYWGMFLLLFTTTFLRTSIDTNSQHSPVSPSSATSNHGVSPSTLTQRPPPSTQRQRGSFRVPFQETNHRRINQLQDADDGAASQQSSPGILPGMHNPTVEKFHHDAGQSVPDDFFFNKTFGKSTTSENKVPQREMVSRNNRNFNSGIQVDWRTVLQKSENRRALQIGAGPRSTFVQNLYQMEEELMDKAAASNRDIASHESYLSTIPDDWRDKLAKTPVDQPIDFLTPVLAPPTKIIHRRSNDTAENNAVILVLSHQGSFIKRQAIRETWAKGHSNVLFVVAQSDCAEFQHDLAGSVTFVDENGAEVDYNRQGNNNSTSRCDEVDHNFLRLEQQRYQDLLEIPMKEKYARLPEKLLQAYHWVLRNVPNVEWIVKSDDDMFVRVNNLARYLKKYNSNVPMVIGEMIYHSKVNPVGKWAELEYHHPYYPFWPKGSAGHVLSRIAAKYFSDMSETLHRYQGEDTSIGIWLDDARQDKTLKDVTYIHAKNMFESHGKQACARPKYMIIGHDLLPDELLECYQNHSHTFTESAWLDDPSEFDEMIRQETGDITASAREWHPASGYKGDTEALPGPGSTNFGYRGTLTKP
jgi:hypothetical protein